MKKRIITIIVLLPITILILFFPINKGLDTALYNYDDFKNSVIMEYENSPEEFTKNFGYEIKDNNIDDNVINELYDKAIYYRNVYSISIAAILAFAIDFLLSFVILYFPSIGSKYKKYQDYINDFHKNKDYYRDILKNYSPVELSVVMNNRITLPSIVATLLSFEKDKIITNNNGIIEFNVDPNDFSNELMKSIYIKNDKVDVYYLSMLKIAREKALEDKLIEKAQFPKKKFILDIVCSIGLYLIPYLYVHNFTDFGNYVIGFSDNILITIALLTSLVISLIILAFFPIYTIIKYIILYGILISNNYKRTEKGTDIEKKLQGLNNYIREFSNLSEREKEELVLWDEYLIYSVLFNHNKKIYHEYRKNIFIKG